MTTTEIRDQQKRDMGLTDDPTDLFGEAIYAYTRELLDSLNSRLSYASESEAREIERHYAALAALDAEKSLMWPEQS